MASGCQGWLRGLICRLRTPLLSPTSLADCQWEGGATREKSKEDADLALGGHEL